MGPEEIIEAYNIVVNDLNNRTAEEAARIGNAQSSLGTLAERVARPSGMTSGLANYTYNRTMRPVIEQSSAALTTSGYSEALDNTLRAELRAAKNRYDDARNNYSLAASGGSGGGNGGNKDGWTEVIGVSGTGTQDPDAPVSKGATNQTVALNNAISAMNQHAAVTGGGQMREVPIGTKFSYTMNGNTHTGYVYPGQGGEIDGMSFTKDGLKNYLDNKVRNGASFQNYLGNDVNYSIWKVQFKI